MPHPAGHDGDRPADRIAVLERGVLLECGTPQALLAGATHAYSRELMAMPQRQSERVRLAQRYAGALETLATNAT